MKMVDKSRINEAYLLMKNSILNVTLRLLHLSVLVACIGVRGDM
jgi:hypothetical protein